MDVTQLNTDFWPDGPCSSAIPLDLDKLTCYKQSSHLGLEAAVSKCWLCGNEDCSQACCSNLGYLANLLLLFLSKRSACSEYGALLLAQDSHAS